MTNHQLKCLQVIMVHHGDHVGWLSILAGTSPQAFGRAGSYLSKNSYAYSHNGCWFITDEGKQALDMINDLVYCNDIGC